MSNCSLRRDVHIYDANDPAAELGGLVLTNATTYVLRHEDVTDVLRDLRRGEQAIHPGNYYIITSAFRNAVRERGRRCVITGEEAIDAEYGTREGFESASGGSINSAQNGMLLRADIHALFDGYRVSINPDDNYKIVCFRRDRNGIATGRHLDQQFLEDPRRVWSIAARSHFGGAALQVSALGPARTKR
ncbi:hypothetical protein DFP73DRAFT_594185 [Morchella snyderi]|nr:hypothetical protein DFP73DRAFT_594185 [Morchella snyderi]